MKKLSLILICAICYGLGIFAQDLSGIKICVNPGHGGFDSDDRNIVIYPYKTGEVNGFWESQSNLDKGLYLKQLLETAGAEVIMTRETNTSADDLALSLIVDTANDNNCDFLLSIHSNAGLNNYILMLCSGRDPDDTQTYRNQPTLENELISREIGTLIGEYLYQNDATHWVTAPQIRGDKTFARTAMGWSDGYGVLRALSIPGVLSEGAMHEYRPETHRMMNMQYKHMEAWNFYRTFCSYFDRGEENFGKVAGVVKDKWESYNESFPVKQSYYCVAGTLDVYKSINGMKVSLLSFDETEVLKDYTTDDMYNGFFWLDSINPGTYKLKFEREYYATLIEEVKVEANKITYANTFVEKDRSEPLVVKSFIPNFPLTEPVAAGTNIRYDFNFEIDSESFEGGFHISPQVSGTFAYEDFQRTAIFIPDSPLEKDTEYTVTLDLTVQHVGGLGLEEEFIFKFKTKSKNEFSLLDYYPLSKQDEVYPQALIKLYFDDKIDRPTNFNDNFTITEVESGKNILGTSYDANAYPGELGSYAIKLSLDPNKEYLFEMNESTRSADSIRITSPLTFTFKTNSGSIFMDGQVEDFEETKILELDTENSVNIVNTSVARLSGTSVSGSRSYRVSYEFTEETGTVYTKFVNPTIKVGNDTYIGIYIWGDLSYNQVSYVILSGDELIELPLTTVDFSGWTFRELKVEGLDANQDCYLYGFKITRMEGDYSLGGSIHIDNLLINSSPLTSVEMHIQNDPFFKIYPVPAKDVIYYSGIIANRFVISSIDGIKVASGNINSSEDKIEISYLSSGVYILTVWDDTKSYKMTFIKE